MIAKFPCFQTPGASLEVLEDLQTKTVSIEVIDEDGNREKMILDDKNLFSLIGRLLKIQHEIKNG